MEQQDKALNNHVQGTGDAVQKRTIQFYKYHVGNSPLLLIDNGKLEKQLTAEEMNFVCNREFTNAEKVVLLDKVESGPIVREHSQTTGIVESGNGLFVLPSYLNRKSVSAQTSEGGPLFKANKVNGHVSVAFEVPKGKCEVREYPVGAGKPVMAVTAFGMSHVAILRPEPKKEDLLDFAAALQSSNVIPNLSSVSFYTLMNKEVKNFEDFEILSWEAGVGISGLCATGICASLVAAIHQMEEMSFLRKLKDFEIKIFNAERSPPAGINSQEVPARYNRVAVSTVGCDENQNITLNLSLPVKKDFAGTTEV